MKHGRADGSVGGDKTKTMAQFIRDRRRAVTSSAKVVSSMYLRDMTSTMWTLAMEKEMSKVVAACEERIAATKADHNQQIQQRKKNKFELIVISQGKW